MNLQIYIYGKDPNEIFTIFDNEYLGLYLGKDPREIFTIFDKEYLGLYLGKDPREIFTIFDKEYLGLYLGKDPREIFTIFDKEYLGLYLGKDPREIFTTFDEEPLGCASLAQVHRATLQNGKEVAVKVIFYKMAGFRYQSYICRKTQKILVHSRCHSHET